MPAPRIPPPAPEVQALLLKHLAALRADFIRTLMRENDIKGLSNNRDQLLGIIRDHLRDSQLPWATLIEFLDRHEPNGKQRVMMLKAPAAQASQFSVSTLQAALGNAGEAGLWGASVPIAAPNDLRLSSVSDNGNNVTVVAIGRRSYRRRASELEDQVDLPRDNLEVQVYEHVDVRAWVRAELNCQTGALNIRSSSMPQQKAQDALADDFKELIEDWFPLDLFQALDLKKAVKELHELERAGTPEALVQAIGYDDASGIKTNLRSASANQSISDAPQLQAAIDTFRSSGQGSDGNFFFLPTSKGGPTGSPIGDVPVRAVIKAAEGRLDFTKPHTASEIAHVLHRVRVLAG